MYLIYFSWKHCSNHDSHESYSTDDHFAKTSYCEHSPDFSFASFQFVMWWFIRQLHTHIYWIVVVFIFHYCPSSPSFFSHWNPFSSPKSSSNFGVFLCAWPIMLNHGCLHKSMSGSLLTSRTRVIYQWPHHWGKGQPLPLGPSHCPRFFFSEEWVSGAPPQCTVQL